MMSYDQKSWICSGVLLSEGVLLTNYHCGGIDPLNVDQFDPKNPTQYWREDIVRDLLLDISFDGDQVSHEYEGVRYLYASKELDYALIEVKPVDYSGPADSLRVAPQDNIQEPAMALNTPLFLIHHPEGNIKQISICKVTATSIKDTPYTPGAEFGHNCDSEKGSSGGPLFDSNGVLVALHHAGFALDDKCNELDKDNKAIPIVKIFEDVRKGNARIYDEYLKNLSHGTQ
jgi:hypothetical protein